MATERDDKRDPSRTLELLWGVQPAPSRGPRPSLSVARIVDTAVAVADGEGLTAVSMRRVAEELGFTTMSLYRYVPSKGDLLDLMADASVADWVLTDDITDDWRADLDRWARANFAAYRAHPWVLDIPINAAPMGPNQVAMMDWALRVMAATGMSGEDQLYVLLLLSSYVRGHALLGFTLSQAESRTGVSEREWDVAYATMLYRVTADGRHPGVAGLLASGVFDGMGEVSDDEWLDDDFSFGLNRILDGIEAYLKRTVR